METSAVERILLGHIGNPNALFVFPTDIALNRWADRALRLRGGGSIAMEQFTAWDRFKNASIRSRVQDRQSIPSVLRRIFVSRLLEENAARVRDGGEGGAVFRSIIPPLYAQGGSAFGPWLASALPQLGRWFESAAGKGVAAIRAEDSGRAEFLQGDDRDLFFLTLRYKEFLDAYGLFEPAWEKPPFDDNGKECFIFFPESLSDFSEYESLLEAAPHVRILRLGDIGGGERTWGTFFYSNARSEITAAALYIRNLADREGVAWEDIAVSLPEGECYEPYVLREFANRDIPAVRRAGKALSDYPAGQLFTGIQDCCVQGFPFAQVSNLLLNSRLPWKNQDLIDQLIDFGIKNNCICSWTEQGRRADVWLDAFRSLAGSREQRAGGYYGEFKGALEKIRGARSFREILRAYFAFRERFLDISQCSAETDAVLSRCIAELLSLAELEDSFPDLIAPDPYGFFIEHLRETTYLAQEKSRGVSILPYRTAAPAPFDCHVVLGSSQDNLSLIFPRLSFLPRIKKERLGLEDIDASEAFIALHRLNSARGAAFFCSRQSFSGFAIPHSSLGVEGEPRLQGAEPGGRFFAPDLFAAEESAIREMGNGGGAGGIGELHEVQAQGFRAWAERRAPAGTGARGPDLAGMGRRGPDVAELLKKIYGAEKPRVSASALEPYYFCSVTWLYDRVLRLESRRMETSLMAENVTGSLYHAVLDRFFKALAKEGGPLAFPLEGAGAAPDAETGTETRALPPAYRGLLAAAVREVFGALPLLPGEPAPLSSLTARFLRAQERVVRRQLELLLLELCGCFGGFRVAGSELRYQVEKQYYDLVGTVDLLLTGGDGEGPGRGAGENAGPGGAVIVDFKLNYLPTRKACTGEGERGLENFQLPMYITLAEASGVPPVRTALFFNILKVKPAVIIGRIRDSAGGKEKPAGKQAIIRRLPAPSGAGLSGPEGEGEGQEGEDKFGAIMAEFEAKTEGYARDIVAGNLSVFSAGESQCGSCRYHRVCRTLYSVDGERDLIAPAGA
jgi:hypothetical protein